MRKLDYYKAYQKGGIVSVIDLANKNKLKCWAYCKECDTKIPINKGECLVCGQNVKK